LMPEFVDKVSAHVSLSVSLTNIHNIINSLSKSAHKELHKAAKMKTMAFAYNNFDMDFKGWAATIKNSGETLKYATSALAFFLHHGVVPDDLKCCTTLWDTNPRNPAESGQ
jgi:hypothetical protein